MLDVTKKPAQLMCKPPVHHNSHYKKVLRARAEVQTQKWGSKREQRTNDEEEQGREHGHTMTATMVVTYGGPAQAQGLGVLKSLPGTKSRAVQAGGRWDLRHGRGRSSKAPRAEQGMVRQEGAHWLLMQLRCLGRTCLPPMHGLHLRCLALAHPKPAPGARLALCWPYPSLWAMLATAAHGCETCGRRCPRRPQQW